MLTFLSSAVTASGKKTKGAFVFAALAIASSFTGCSPKNQEKLGFDQVEIVSQGINESKKLEIRFKLKTPNLHQCPGIKFTGYADGKINVRFVVQSKGETPSDCDSYSETAPDTPGTFQVQIPHDWSAQPSAEISIDGNQTLGQWQLEGQNELNTGELSGL